MEDYLRLYLGKIVGVIVALVVTMALAAVAKRYVPAESRAISTGRNVLMVAVLFGFGIYLFTSGSVNVTPRKVIDRSDVLQQQKAFEERHKEDK
mgnify:CR=1 FL=1